jgi:hypothetical protein
MLTGLRRRTALLGSDKGRDVTRGMHIQYCLGGLGVCRVCLVVGRVLIARILPLQDVMVIGCRASQLYSSAAA